MTRPTPEALPFDPALDEGRRDLTRYGFFTTIGSREHATRVRQFTHGDFLVEAAISDMSAIKPRLSDETMVLPEDTKGQLEFNGLLNRAVVISRIYSPEARPLSEVRVERGWVNIRYHGFETFAGLAKVHNDKNKLNRVADYHERCMRRLVQREDYVPELEGMEEKKYGRRVARTFIMLAGLAAAEWAEERDLPFIYRVHTRVRVGRKMKDTRGYSPLPAVHVSSDRFADRPNAPYAHVAAPVRHAADRVNNKQMLAVIKGEEPPYSQSDIEALVYYLSSQPK